MVSNGQQGPPVTKRQAQSNRRAIKRKNLRDVRQYGYQSGEQAQKAGTNSMVGRILGSGGGMAALWALSAFVPAIGIPVMYALAAGAGSYYGSKKGEKNVGGYDIDPLEGNLFYKDEEEDIINDMNLLQNKADTARVKNAGIDALTAYLSVGGNLPGLKGANKPISPSAASAVGPVGPMPAITKPGFMDMVKTVGANLGEKATAPSLGNLLESGKTLSAIQAPFSIYNYTKNDK
jgi:hypothetical protein